MNCTMSIFIPGGKVNKNIGVNYQIKTTHCESSVETLPHQYSI